MLNYLKNVVLAETPSISSSQSADHTLPIVFDATEDPTLNNLTRSDANCDKTGTCYDGKILNQIKFNYFFDCQLNEMILFVTVAVHCKDTRIAVQVRTNKPFNGRIYALGRSETCNIDVINSDAFRLDLTMGGQDCNTQSIVSYRFASS